MLADLAIEIPHVPGAAGGVAGGSGRGGQLPAEELGEAALWVYRVAFEAGAYARPLLSST